MKQIAIQMNKLQLVPLLLFFLFFFSGCKQTIKQDEMQRISLMLDWVPSPTHIPLYHGFKEGFFKAEGIDLHLIKKGESDPVHLLYTQSEIDLVISYMPRVMRIQESFGPVMTVIGSLIEVPLNGFLGLADTISSPGMMNGKRIGFSGSKFSSSTLDALLGMFDISAQEKLNVRMDLIPQLLLGNVDLIWGAFRSIESRQIEQFGKRASFFSVELFGMPSYHELIIVSALNGVLIKKNLVGNFQRALQKSIHDAITRESIAIENYFSFFPEKRGKCEQWERKAWSDLQSSFAKSQAVSIAEIEQLYRWQQEKRLIGSSLNKSLLFNYLL